MASSYKTTHLGLNSWTGSDKPKRIDFVTDNEILDEALEDTVLLISSHSPFFIQYIKPERIYLGVPNEAGTAKFSKVQESRLKNLIDGARRVGMSVGEYLFELMSGDQDSADILSFYLEE